MCGLCGFVGDGDRGDLAAMTEALAHRGPDGAGLYVDPERPVYLGHRRLAVIDLEGGVQPMWTADGQLGVVFNGEIYNHGELRGELEGLGHAFVSDHSDTEVLLHGYRAWGDELPARLDGMFALAIYDRSRQRLLLARDRFGKKPLYYTHRRGLFAFASELTALARHPRVDRGIDARSLQKLLVHSFLPAPNALYRGSRKLPGGWMLTYDLAADKLRTECYWRFRIEPEATDREADELADELRGLFSRAVKRRLMSDVPLGIFLSGGLDSSAIVAFAAQHVPAERIKTFSIGFREPSYDESAHARRVARFFGTDHHERVFSIDEARQLAPAILGTLDEPLGDASILPTHLLARFARESVTVALGGDGGDELFAGYDPFRALRPAQWYRRCVPGWLHAGLRRAAGHLPVSPRNMSLDFKLRRALRGVSFPPALWNPVWLGAIEPADLAELFHKPLPIEDLFSEALSAWDECGSDDVVDRSLEFYTRLYLQDDILQKLDRATMLVGLEARCPFLDNDLVDFVRRLPSRYKLAGGCTKVLLRRMLRDVLPDDILSRPKKGFGVPLQSWLGSLSPEPRARQMDWNADWVSARWREHAAGRADHRGLLWLDLALAHHGRAWANEEAAMSRAA